MNAYSRIYKTIQAVYLRDASGSDFAIFRSFAMIFKLLNCFVSVFRFFYVLVLVVVLVFL